MNNKMKKKIEIIIKIVSLLLTFLGAYWAIFQNLGDGVLIMILGELVDLPYRLKNKN